VSELQVIARHAIAAGNEDKVYALLAELRYTSREAFADHRETHHFKEIMLGQILPLLANRDIEQYDVLDGGTG
jgi:hypothetical protein